MRNVSKAALHCLCECNTVPVEFHTLKTMGYLFSNEFRNSNFGTQHAHIYKCQSKPKPKLKTKRR